jgi:hypothetical protein
VLAEHALDRTAHGRARTAEGLLDRVVVQRDASIAFQSSNQLMLDVPPS